jgi:DNA-binding SARP family transcriptional activator
MANKQPSIAKVSRPVVAETYSRRRLFKLLDRNRKQPVIWIAGPAGSGKTTLVSSYIDEKKLPCLWYRLDEGDADLATFFYYMGIAGKKANPRKRRPLPLLTPEYMMGVPTFTKRYFENLYSRLKSPAVVVLDNYQEVPEDSHFHGMLCSGLSVIPEGVTVIVMSRKTPPSELVSLCAGRTIKTIGWEDIRLTLQETRGIMQVFDRKLKSKDIIKQFHEKTLGWVAGVVILLERAKTEGFKPLLESVHTLKEIFDYFAGEIFEKTNKETRAFLLKTVFLPEISDEMAGKLTGIHKADKILSSLHSSHFFTERRLLPAGAVYRYHPLFKEFLIKEAVEHFRDTELFDIQQKAASLLEGAGQTEEAAELHLKTGDLKNLIPLILKSAQNLIMQGRSRTVDKWLKGIPENVVENAPWLLFWRGMCMLQIDSLSARDSLVKAYKLFKQENDVVGLFLSWSGIVDTFIYKWSDFKPLDPWIEEMENVIRSGVDFPSQEIEARVTFCMFAALSARKPYAIISRWAESVKFYIEHMPASDAGLMILYLCMYRSWLGDFDFISNMLQKYETLLHLRDCHPLSKITYLFTKAFYSWNMNLKDDCLKSVNEGIRLANTSGVHILDHYLINQNIYGTLSAGDLSGAEVYLDKVKATLSLKYDINTGHYNFLKAWYHALKGERERAIDLLESSTKAGEVGGMTFPTALNQVELAGLLTERKDFKRAEELLKKVNYTATEMKSAMLEIKYLLFMARMSFIRGKVEAGKSALKESFEIMRKKGFVNLPWWRPDVMADLCAKALEHGIEIDYVLDLIKKRKLIPDIPPVHIENWPWKVKIYTLGRFSIVKNEKPLKFSGKVQKMPLAMLKALIALGGREISEEQLSDALWPDADGDLAHRSFETTLHRLRKLLGSAEIVKLREGRLTLDPRTCWVDAWAFERIVGEVDEQWAKGIKKDKKKNTVSLAEKAIRLYGGTFLSGDEEDHWTVSMRERLRDKFLRSVERLGKHCQQTGQLEQALECFRSGLDVDNLAEPFYQRLMTCYGRLGRKAEAVAVYNRCQEGGGSGGV